VNGTEPEPPAAAPPDRIRAARGVIMVTGATAGIGFATALSLAEAGYHVIGTSRRPESAGGPLLDAVRRGDITLVRLDLADPASVDTAAAEVCALLKRARVPGLAGLVNNAGAAVVGPVETVGLDQLRWQFEVNVFSQISLTRQLLPALREARGRIVNIGSVAAWISMPFLSPLAASKGAFRLFNDALRLEVKPAGVQVILIEPGRVNSAAPGKVLEEVDGAVERMPEDLQIRYAAAFRTMIGNFVSRAQAGISEQSVADVVVKAVTGSGRGSRRPVGTTTRRLQMASRFLPNPVLDRVRYRLFGLSDFAKSEVHS